MRKTPLGDHELELLRYVAQYGPLSVGQALEGYGTPRGLARSTINTTIERLYKKGYLTRVSNGDVFHYSAAMDPNEVMDGLVELFVENTLAGSITPFVSYFAKRSRLTAAQQTELAQFIAKLESQNKDKESEK